MAVDPDDIEAIVAQVSAIYREAELAVTRRITRHLEEYPGAPTAELGDQRMEAIGKLRKSVESIQASLEADGSQQLRDSIARSWGLGNRSALSDIPAELLPGSGIGEAAEEAREQVPQTGAIEALAERLIKDVGTKVRNMLRDALDAYREAVAGATARMLAGGQSRREATQAAWSNLVKRGITGFTDKSGRTWRLSSYVEMATRTASARAAVEGQTDRLASLGIGFVYVSDHGQECPLCRPWEGAVLRRSDDGPTGEIDIAHALTEEPVTVDVAGTLDQARASGLFHPNCRHSVSAYLPGVTQIPEPRGQDPDAYRARMKQRSIERDIRKAKEERAAAFTEDAKRAANAKVRRKQKQLREHLADNPELKRLRYREQTGAGSTPSSGRDDAATGIGPDVQPSFDGGTEPVIKSSARLDPKVAPPPQQRGFRGRNKEPRLVHTLPDLSRIPDDDREELAEYLRRPLNVDQQLQHALYLYTSRRNRAINRSLRGGLQASRRLRDTISNIDKALKRNRLPVPARVTRVVGIDAFGLSSPEQVSSLVGTFLDDPAFVSTTLGTPPNVPVGGDAVLMDIRVPAGTPAAFVESITKYPGQLELVLPRNTSLVIHKIDRDNENNRWILHAYAREQ